MEFINISDSELIRLLIVYAILAILMVLAIAGLRATDKRIEDER